MERCINQQVCVIPGLTYTFTYSGSRRIDPVTPATPGIQIKVTGTSSGTNYVNQNQTFNNTSWDLHAYNYTVTIPAGSPDKKVNIQFTDYNNTSTYGVLISNIMLSVSSSNTLSIHAPATTAVGSPNNFFVNNAPSSGVSYNWSFPGGGTPSTSTSNTPTGITYSSIGTKTVSVNVGNGTCTMASYSKSLTVSALLPLEMVSFTGALKENAALLTWMTTDETDNKYFVVERSSDGRPFDSVGVVAAKNGSSNEYNFTDYGLLSGSNNYRLRQVDIDGGARYSKVISIGMVGAASSAKMQVFPNPTLSVLNYTVTSASADLVDVQIFSLSGALVLNSQQQLSAGLNQHSLTVSDLKNGSYFLKVTGRQGTTQLVQLFTKF